MDRYQWLMMKLAEESGALFNAAIKSSQFNFDKKIELNYNRTEVVNKLIDVIAVINFLQKQYELGIGVNVESDFDLEQLNRYQQTIEKIVHHYEYSRQEGMVE